MTPRALILVVLPMLLLASADRPWLDSPLPSQSATDRAWQQHADKESQWWGRQMWLRDLRDAPMTPPPRAGKPVPTR